MNGDRIFPDVQEARDRLSRILASRIPGFRDEVPCTGTFRATPDMPLARRVDHTLLKPGAGSGEYRTLCAEAREWGTASVCVPSCRVALAREALEGSGVAVCTVAGFPFGYASSRAKAEETRQALAEGAAEVDMVISLGLAREGDWAGVWHDIREVREAAGTAVLKVILEASELDGDQLALAAWAACLAGADFLKTSTGFASGGARVEDVRLLRAIAGDRVGVKASGGIRNAADAHMYIQAGADRLGTSQTRAILGLDGSSQGGY